MPRRFNMSQIASKRRYLLLGLLVAMAAAVLIAALVVRHPDDQGLSGAGDGPPGTPSLSYSIEAPPGLPFRPRGVVIAGTRAFVADSEGGRLGVVDLGQGPQATLDFLPVSFDRPGEELPARPQPAGLGLLRDGTLLMADSANGRLWRIGQNGQLLGDFPATEERARSQLQSPVGVAVSGDEVYVTDVGDQRVKVYSDTGRFLRSLGGPGYLPGQLAFPNGIALNGAGEMWLADSNNRRVQLLSAKGEPLLLIDRGDKEVRFDLPRAVALDRLGRLHVVDTFAQTIYVFDSDGNALLGYGQGADSAGRLNLPEGVALDRSRIVVSDGGNRRLVVYTY